MIFIIFFGLSVNVHADTPQISQILPQETREGIAISVPFTVTADSQIVSVQLESSNQTLVPNDYLMYECNANHCTLVATPRNGQTGSTTISIAVTDIENFDQETRFILTVTDFEENMYFWKNHPAATKSIENNFELPVGTAIDPTTGKLFVSDTDNHRVFRFAKGNTTISEAFFGDAESYTMNNPMGIHVDSFGRLWVADMANHRVLRFDHASTKPTRAPPDGILGKADFSEYSKTSQNAMTSPTDVWLDPTGTLWVADSASNRILRFDDAAQKENYANANAVLGQPDFTSLNNGITQSKMNTPRSIVMYQGHLFVADFTNNRVLCYKNVASKSFLDPADLVLGQPDFETFEPNLSASGMNLPSGLAIDPHGRLYVSEQNNNRVLIFDNAINKSNGDSANNVLGQANFISKDVDYLSYQSLYAPYVLNYDAFNNHLWIPDPIHNRVVRFDLELKQPPSIGKIDDQTIDENTNSNPITFTVTDTNEQSLTITYEYANANLLASDSFAFSGHQVTSHNGMITVNATSVYTTVSLILTPVFEQFGSTTVWITVTDPHGMQDTQSFTLNVLEINDPPTITNIGNQTINEDAESAPIYFTVTDIEGDQLHIEVFDDALDLFPSNADNITLSNENGGTTWQLTTDSNSDLLTLLLRPDSNRSGTSNLTVTVSDGEKMVHTNFTMTVVAQNDRPNISNIANQSIDEDTQSQAIVFNVFDPDAAHISIAVTSGNQTLIPSDTQHITLANELGNTSYTLTTDSVFVPLTLYVMPTTNLSGTSVITITATDGELSSSRAFTMTVLSVNDPPIISAIENQTTLEDTPISDIDFTVNDIDTSTLSIEILSNSPDIIPSDPAHITLYNASGETAYTLLAHPLDRLWLALRPAKNATGIAEIIVKVTGGSTYATTSFMLTVIPINDAPVLSKIENQYTLEDTPLTIPFDAIDYDADPLTLTIATGNELLIPSDNRHLLFQSAHGHYSNTFLTVPGGEAISLTVLPLLNQSGKTTITITASDGIAQVSQAFIMSITGVNDIPILSTFKNQTVFEDTATHPIAFTVLDADYDALTISVASANALLIPSDTNHITLRNATGDHSYTLTCQTGEDLHLVLQPSLNSFGSTTISITVTDGTLFSSQSFPMTVIPVNDAPIVSPIPNMTIDEDTVSPKILFSVADPESDPFTIEIQSNNEDLIATHTRHITLQGKTGGDSYTLATSNGPLTLTLHPNLNQIGTSEILIHSTDGKDRSSQSFILTVTEINDLPVISFIPDQATIEDTQSAPILFKITDVDATRLSISIHSGNENLLPINADHITLCNASGGNTYTLLTHEKNNNLILTVLPASNQTDDILITVQVSDTYSTVSQSFALFITPVNDKPVIAPISDHSDNEDMPEIQIPFTAFDFEDPACSLGITLISSNQTLLANDHMTYSCHENMYTIVAHTSHNQNGLMEITVIVTDHVGAWETSTFALSLTPVNDAPTIDAPTQVRVKMNYQAAIPDVHIEDCDAGSDLLAITLVTDDGTILMSHFQGELITFTGSLDDINTELNALHYHPTFNALGSRAITISVNDMGHSGEGGKQMGSKKIWLQIHDDNVKPVNFLPSLTMYEDESGQITPISVFDLDAESNAIEVTLSIKHGYLTLGETDSITLIAGKFQASTQVTFSGSQYEINHALEHLTITCTTHFNGWAALTMTTNDLGHTGESYSPQTAINAVPITVLATIDPPTHRLPELFAVIEDTPTAFTSCVIDPDGEDIISVDLEVSTGTLQLNSGKGLTGFLATHHFLSFTGKKSDVNHAMEGMIYQPMANDSGSYTFTMTYHDMDFEAHCVSIPLHITAINDPPVIHIATSAITIVEDTPISLSLSVSDIEAGENAIQVYLNSSNSQLQIIQTEGLTVYPANNSQNLTLTGSIDSLNKALEDLRYTPTNHFYGNSFIAITIDDMGYTPLPAESSQKTISITITPVNDPPDFILSQNKIAVFEDFSPQVITLNRIAPIFGEPTQVTYTLTPEPETITWASITFSPEAGKITITSVKNMHGAARFTISADDGALENNIASHDFTLTISAVNDPPDFILSKDKILLDEDFSTTESISLTPDFIPEDEPQTITYALHPNSLTWVNLAIDSETGQISITSIPNAHGEQQISVIADDGEITATHHFAITVVSINDLPQITSDQYFSISENASIGTKVHHITAIDDDHQNLIYKIDAIVPDASFTISQNTGEIWISNNLDYESIKSYTMTVSVSDPLSSVNQTIFVTITDLNDAPILLNVPEQTLTTYQEEPLEIKGMMVSDIDAAGHPIQLTLIATNGVVSITHTLLTLESGNYSSTFLSVSGTITAINQALTSVWFNPMKNYKGYASIDVEINDLGHTGPGIAQSDSESISIYILNYNQPPIFTEYEPHAICYEDQSLTQRIVIFDEDAIDEAIQLTLISENGCLTLSNQKELNRVYFSEYVQSYTGTIQEMNAALSQLIFMPEKEFSGTAGYTLYANDFGHSGIGGPKNAEPAVVTITCFAVNDPPIHSLPFQVTGLEDSDIPLTLTVNDIDAYTNAIHVELKAIQGVISLTQMDGLTLSNKDHVAGPSLSFTGTIDDINDAMSSLIFHPSPNFYGHASLTITSNDLGFSVPQGQAEAMTETDFLTITVFNVNDAPDFQSTPLQIIDEDSVYSYTILAGDIDGENVSLTVTRLPDWLTFSDFGNNTGIIQGIPKNEHVGTTLPLTIVATDPNQARSIQSFSIEINNTNDVPFFQSTPIVQATEDSLYRYTVTAGDIDKDASLIIRGNELPDWLYLKDYGNGTALLSGIPKNKHVGTVNVVILSVSDGISTLIKQAFLIDVTNTNDPPEIISSPVFTATEDAAYKYTIAAYDMDGDTVSFIATALPEWLSLINIGQNKAVIQGIPFNENVGRSETLIITAHDSFYVTASQSFAITVINTNDTPYFSSEPIIEATEDNLYVYTITVQDVDIGASIRIQAAILTDWLTCIDNGDGTAIISGIPRNEHVGIKNAAVINATDGIIDEDIEQSYMITVLNTNDPPNIISTPVLTATEDAYYSYTIVAEDMDGDSLYFIVDALPQWLSLINHPNNTATLYGMPKNEDVGLSQPLTITAKDPDHMTATQCFSINVYNTNDRPVFISQPKITAIEDRLYAYTIHVLDVDIDDSVEIKAIRLPHWLSFTDYGNRTASISGIPLNEDVHKIHDVVLTANDGTETALSQSFIITVINTNDQPVITSSAVLTATEDEPYIYTITAADMDGDQLEFLADLPSWLSLIDHGNNTAILKGIPENSDVGLSKTITITTRDPSEATASQYFEVFVINTNDAPFFKSNPQETAIEDSIYHYTITVADVDSESSIRIDAANLPDWLMIVDNGNGIANLTGTPLNDHVGVSNPLVITASDGIAPEITQTFSITVANTNDKPEITSAAVLTATEDVLYAYTVTAQDIDGDLLSFQSQMPSWLSLIYHGNSTATLKGTPKNDNVGISSPIILTALDPDKASATQTFEITVHNTNDAPIFKSMPVISAIEDSEYTYAIHVQDVDQGAIIQIHAESVPNWLTLMDNGNGFARLSGIPKNEHVGDHPVRIIATDNIAKEISQSFTITVANTNDPPIITTILLPSVDEDTNYNALLTAEDMDGDTVQFTSTSLPSWLTLINHGNNTGSLQGTPKNENIGQTETFLIIATDPDGASASRSFSFMVYNTNDAPTFLSIPNTAATEDSVYNHMVVVQDIDPDPTIKFIILPQFPEWLSITDNGDGTAIITGIPLNENVGENYIGISASDGIALPKAYIYSIYVENTNDPPVITSNSIQSVDEDASYHYLITGDDMDGDPLRFVATGLPSWLKLSDNGNSTARLEGVPTNNDVGRTETITITAIDPSHSIATQSFQITVTNTNDSPWFISKPNTLGIEDITYSHTIRVEDIDIDASLRIQAKRLPSWLNLTDNGNGTATLTGKPLNEHVGNNDIVITVSDELAPPVSQAFSIWVTNTNDTPVIISNSKQIIYEDALYTYEIHAEDVDQEDHLHFIVESLPDWLAFTDNDDHTAVLQGIPQNHHVGETSLLTITVIDEAGESDYQSFTILVINTNDCPEISTISSQSSQEYATTSPFSFTVTDMDADELTIHASSSDTSIVAIDASHITFCTQSCHGESIQLTSTHAVQPISLTILPVRDGVAKITITVADDELSASTSFILTVTNVNIPPQISPIPDTTIDEDAGRYPISFTVVDTDGDSRELTVTAMTDTPTLLPTNSDHVSIDEMGIVHHLIADTPVDLNLFVSPLPNQSGRLGITLTVMDADGDLAMQHFQLTVNKRLDDSPELSHIENISFFEDTTAYQVHLTVMDPDGGNLTIAVQSSNQQLLPSENIVCQNSSLSPHAHEFENLTLTMHPIADENGSVTITITAMDEQDHTAENSFLLTVIPVNDAPYISNIASVNLDEDTVNYPISFTIVDADGDDLHLDTISSNTQLVSDIHFQNPISTNAGKQKIVNALISTQENAFGSSQITVIVTDPSGKAARSTFDCIVNPINDPPHISSILPQYIYEETISNPIELTISDQESGPLAIYVETSNNAVLPISCLTFAGKSNGSYMAEVISGEAHNLTLIIMPPPDINGAVNIKLLVYDSHNLYHLTQFPLIILPVNDMPTFDLKDVSLDINEDDGLQSFSRWVTNISAGAKNETDSLSFIIETQNNHLFASSPQIHILGTTGTLTFAPTPDAFGTALIGVSLTDGYSTTTEKSFRINIHPVNDSPDITTKITALKTNENQSFAPIPFTIYDIDDDKLTISVFTDTQFFSDISICSGTDCQQCSETSCEFQYIQTSKQKYLEAMLETLKRLTNITDNWNADIQDIDKNTKITLAEAIYYIKQVSTKLTLQVSPQTWQSGIQLLTLMVSDHTGHTDSQSISFSVTPISNPPILTVHYCEGFEDDLIPVSLDLELVDKDSEELLNVLISGVPAGAYLNKGIKRSGKWILTPDDLNHLLIAPESNSSDDFTLIVTASSKERTLSQKATVVKDVFIDVIPVADNPSMALKSSTISGQVDQDIPIVFKNLQLTDTDGSEQWDRIEIVRFDPNLQFSKGTLMNGKWVIDLSHQTEIDLSNVDLSVKSSNASSSTFVMRVFSKEKENKAMAMSDLQVNLSVHGREETSSSGEKGGCFITILGL